MNKTLAYTAGYIDGDGCFFLRKSANPIKYRAEIIISSTNEEALIFFKEKFGGCIQIQTFRYSHWKKSYHWIIRGKYALELNNKIIRFLIEKRKDSLIFTKYQKEYCKLKKEELIHIMRDSRNASKNIDEFVVQEVRNTEFIGVSNPLDFPYLSGFIDAECCFGISKYKPKDKPNFIYKISLQCTNTNPSIFFWLMERFGGSISHVKRRCKNPKHSDQIVWSLTGEALSKLLPNIHPYLISKKTVCEKLMEFYNTNLPNGGDRHSEEFKNSYAIIISKREKLVEEIHVLNSKGFKCLSE